MQTASDVVTSAQAEVDRLTTSINELKELRLISSGRLGWVSGNTQQDLNRLNILSSVNWAKHRTNAMDPMERLIGANEINLYVNHIYRTMAANAIKIKLLNVLPNLLKTNPQMARFLVNRVKMTFGNLTYNDGKGFLDLKSKKMPLSWWRRIKNTMKKMVGRR